MTYIYMLNMNVEDFFGYFPGAYIPLDAQFQLNFQW